MNNKMTVTYIAHNTEISFTIPDDSTWLEVLDLFIATITGSGGYRISRGQLKEWVEGTEVFDD